MLSAFTARPLIELKPRDKSRIESVLAYGDRVLAGLNNGSLRIYRVNEKEGYKDGGGGGGEEHIDDGEGRENGNAETHTDGGGDVKAKTDLLREIERFSRYKIEQLAYIKESKLLISLAGGYVSIHDLQTYELQEQLVRTKGASTFAVTSNIVNDVETGVPSIVSRLAVAVKRRILFWSWRDMELESETREMTVVSGVKSLAWVSGTKLVAGLSSSFVMIDIQTGAVTDLAGPGSIGGLPGQDAGGSRLSGVGVASMSYIGIGGSAPKPLATRLKEGQVLLAKDINTHFIDLEGNSLGRRQVPWSHAPVDVGYSYPFLLALHDSSKGVLEVRNPETLSLLQSVSLPAATLMHIPQPNISLAHAGKGFLVASDRVVWRMEALSYDTQIDALVEKGYLDEAISLLDMLEDALLRDKPSRLRQIKLEKAQNLFAQRKYQDSLDLFTEISAPPEVVIRLYPRLIAGDLSIEDDTATESETGSPTDGQSKQLNGTHNNADANGSDGSSSPKVIAQAPSVASLLRAKADDGSDAGSIRGKNTVELPGEKRLVGKDLKTAVWRLQGYLAGVRRRFQRVLNPDGSLKTEYMQMNVTTDDELAVSVMRLLGISPDDTDYDLSDMLLEKARLVDTTLFRAHMYATPSLAGSLFRIANFCDPNVVMEKLDETGRHNDLIEFLYGKKMHRQALELLRKFGQAEETDGEDKEDEGEAKDDTVSSQLRGPKRTVGYLQNLAPDQIDLILEFAEWPLRADPDMGMEIFLADTENAETLPRQRVLEFLEGIDRLLAVRYLEHVIGELNDMTPALHQRLLVLYLDCLHGHKSGETKFTGETEYAEWRGKFLEMLKTSSQYSPAKMLDRLDRDDPECYEPRAIVFSKMGQHRQALEIYVFKLEDYSKAEEYCNQVHLAEDIGAAQVIPSQRTAPTDAAEAQPSIYLTLLSLYLSPPHGHEPQYGPALDILARHGSRLPANSALELIPETLPVRELEFYFTGRIRAANSVFNESRIVAQLEQVQNVKTQAQLLTGEGPDRRATRSRHVTITEQRICGVCHKRLGSSVINIFPEYVFFVFFFFF
ncbi:hypothetical protein ASPZODRAFT_141835 [Penicilliopsis zonata CBS 506.65]|uniref:CNH domain-containing protein n=1 Tax=Penicilliopsis zonata CBS 506.65 TaxID=1073090 RepID=A0A1L9SIZ0_9EURO|nr:hypothetical protein ASPZODRAFT_141835 [Penicilliopsis zonata CBS 506.65]OJJ47071.1 hypothetical protein ASPZODRAFT_141835 [Penicilliopsis zonata CBS 506.65]